MLNWIDFALLGVIALSTIISIVRGFVKEAISLVVWFAALFIASEFYPDVAVYLTSIQDTLVKNGIAIACLFIATLILGGLLNHAIGQLVKLSGISGTDRLLGALFGALRGVLVCSALLFFADTFTASSRSQWWADSLLIPEFSVVIQWFFEYVEGSSSFIKSV